MNAEIISIGTELLLGQIVDTNSAWIARRLAASGVNLFRTQTVGDNQQRAAAAIRESLARADLVITTGGLGPTVDDVTRAAIADATGRALHRDPEQVARVTEIFARWGRTPAANNLRQADLPEGAEALHNPIGTAPGVLLELPEGKLVVAVPGVPREMKQMIDEQLLPRLRERGVSAIIKVKLLRTAALGESDLDNLIADLESSENPTVGLAAHTGTVDIRLTARAASVEEADRLLEHMATKVRRRVSRWLYGEDDETLEGIIAAMLAECGAELALFETLPEAPFAATLRDAGVPLAASEAASPAELPSEEVAQTHVASFAAEHRAAWGLAIFSTGTGHAYIGERGESLIAIVGPSEQLVQRHGQGGADPISQRWLMARALMLLRRAMMEAEAG